MQGHIACAPYHHKNRSLLRLDQIMVQFETKLTISSTVHTNSVLLSSPYGSPPSYATNVTFTTVLFTVTILTLTNLLFEACNILPFILIHPIMLTRLTLTGHTSLLLNLFLARHFS